MSGRLVRFREAVMRRFVPVLLAAVLLAAAGCTTRTDKDKNKDYDKPRSSGQADVKTERG